MSPLGLDIKTAAIVFTSISALVSPFVTLAVANEKIRNQEETNRTQWNSIKESGDLVKKHEAILPQIEKRLDKMDDKLDRIYNAVRT